MAELSVEEMGRRGGLKTLSKYGTDHFRKIGRRGGQRTKELHWDRFAEWGTRGGRPPKQCLQQVMEGKRSKDQKGG